MSRPAVSEHLRIVVFAGAMIPCELDVAPPRPAGCCRTGRSGGMRRHGVLEDRADLAIYVHRSARYRTPGTAMASGAVGGVAQRRGAAALGSVHRRRPTAGRPVAARGFQPVHLDTAGHSAGRGGTSTAGMDPLVVRAAAHFRRLVCVCLPALTGGEPRGQHHRRGVFRGGRFCGDHQLAADRGGSDLAAPGLPVLPAQSAWPASDFRLHLRRWIFGPFAAGRTSRRAVLCRPRHPGAGRRRTVPRRSPMERRGPAHRHRVRDGAVRRRSTDSARGGIRPPLGSMGELAQSRGLALDRAVPRTPEHGMEPRGAHLPDRAGFL